MLAAVSLYGETAEPTNVSKRYLAFAFFCGIAAMGAVRLVTAGLLGVLPRPLDAIAFLVGAALAVACISIGQKEK